MKFCNNCGAEVAEGMKFCSVCGTPVAGDGFEAAPARGLTVRAVYQRAFALLSLKPLRLWGVSLMCTLLTVLATVFGVLPIISLPIVLVLSAGMKMVYLDGIRGGEVDTEQLFAGFSSFFRIAGGMGWMALWTLIWTLVPVAGPVLGIIKAYSYRFTPYILMNDPDISVTQALKASMEMTEGMKGKMFGADVLIFAGIIVIGGLFSLLTLVGGLIGGLFLILAILFELLVTALCPLLFGIIEATFYDEKVKE